MNRIKWFDSVRAFGLFLVLVYHLFYNILPAGFLGVDVFFTFSGFLITAHILEEVHKKGSFGLLQFFGKRIRRIMIPLVLSVVFTLPLALLISPDFTINIDKQVASALSFTSNWYFIYTGSSYEAQLLPQLYTHTWTLAVIIQFYIAWGLVSAFAAAVLRAFFSNNIIKLYASVKTTMLALSVIFAAGSYIYLILLLNAGNELNFIYFNTLSRFFPFFIGSAAAAVWGINRKQDSKLKKRFFAARKKIKAAALLLLTALCVTALILAASRLSFDDVLIYRYGFLFTSLLTVVLIYCMHGLHILTPRAMKEPRALNVASEMSYDIYLYHWPLYIVLSALIMDHTAASMATLGASLLFAAVMLYGVQRVLVSQKKDGGTKRKRFAMIAVCTVSIIAAAAGGVVIAKAPVITSIESDFASGHIVQDTRGLVSIKLGIGAINDSPVLYAGDDPLQANLLPGLEPAKPSEPSQPQPSPSLPPPQKPQLTPPPQPSPSTSPQPSPSPSPQPQPSPSPSPMPPAPMPNLDGIIGGVTVIGDSVPLGAQATLVNTIPDCYVDATTNRTVSEGLGIVRGMQNRGELREYVVIALATNGTDQYERLLTQIIDAIEPGHRVIFVTPYDGRTNNNARWVNETAEWIRGLPAQYEFITVADWNELIGTQSNLLAGDRVHMGGIESMRLYASMVAEAIAAASEKPVK